eukprot:15371519-Alexandrium_andersonii.AAC.1
MTSPLWAPRQRPTTSPGLLSSSVAPLLGLPVSRRLACRSRCSRSGSRGGRALEEARASAPLAPAL